jgi:hypothetical protein
MDHPSARPAIRLEVRRHATYSTSWQQLKCESTFQRPNYRLVVQVSLPQTAAYQHLDLSRFRLARGHRCSSQICQPSPSRPFEESLGSSHTIHHRAPGLVLLAVLEPGLDRHNSENHLVLRSPDGTTGSNTWFGPAGCALAARAQP